MNQNFTARAIGKVVLQAPAPTEKTQMPEPAFSEQDWRRFLASLGEDPDRPGLVETPSRVAKAWKHWTSGYAKDPAECLKVFEDGAEQYNELIVVRNIPVYSHCEHHQARQLRQAHYFSVGNIADRGAAKERRQMVLAMAVYRDAAYHDEFVVLLSPVFKHF